jgi:hypothetical protein
LIPPIGNRHRSSCANWSSVCWLSSGNKRCESQRGAGVLYVRFLAVPVSRGTIQRAVDQVSAAIQPHDESITEEPRGAKVSYVDERPR